MAKRQAENIIPVIKKSPPKKRAPKAGVTPGIADAQQAKPAPTAPPRKKRSDAYVPNDKDRRIVMLAAACGFTNEQVAQQVGLSETTVKAYYPEELTRGKERVTLQIASNLVGIATQTRDLKASLTASIFWLKCRGGFNDGSMRSQEVNVEASGPVKVTLRLGDREEQG